MFTQSESMHASRALWSELPGVGMSAVMSHFVDVLPVLPSVYIVVAAAICGSSVEILLCNETLAET